MWSLYYCQLPSLSSHTIKSVCVWTCARFYYERHHILSNTYLWMRARRSRITRSVYFRGAVCSNEINRNAIIPISRIFHSQLASQSKNQKIDVCENCMILGEPPPAMIAALSEEVALVAMPPEIEPGNIRRMWDQVLSHVLLKHRLGRKSVCYGNLFMIKLIRILIKKIAKQIVYPR